MREQMTIERRQAYAEILKILGNDYSDRVPSKVREFFQDHAEKDYKFEINTNSNISEQIQNPITINLLGMLRYKYWCKTGEEQQLLLKKFSENDKNKEQEKREKYNPDNIFKDTKKQDIKEQVNTQTSIVEYKETIFTRMKKWLKNIVTKFK